MARILVTTEAITLDRTSEGICSSKFLLALHRAGYDVWCLTSDQQLSGKNDVFFVSWLPDIPIIHIQNNPRLVISQNNTILNNKVDAIIAYITGWSKSSWEKIKIWENSIQNCIVRLKPNLLFVRGAGTSFQPHLAMVKTNQSTPWVANYHDPFPLSNYPLPYRKLPLLIRINQQRWNKRILYGSTALTFPSIRLRNWQLRHQSSALFSKSFIVPHLADQIIKDDSILPKPTIIIDNTNFNLLHMGTLLGPRNPNALLEGYNNFLQKSEERKKKAKLFFVGLIDKSHRHMNGIRHKLVNEGSLIIVDHRIDYLTSIELAKYSDILILIDSNCEESPFFPGKLAEYLSLSKPIIAITPQKSTTRDLLPSSYPLLVLPDNPQMVENAISLAWDCWNKKEIENIIPPHRCAAQISEPIFRNNIRNVFNFCSVYHGLINSMQMP